MKKRTSFLDVRIATLCLSPFLLLIPMYADANATGSTTNASSAQTLVTQGNELKIEIDQKERIVETIKVSVSNAMVIAENRMKSTDVSDAAHYRKAIDYGQSMIRDCEALSTRVEELLGQYHLSGNADLNALRDSVSDLNTILTRLTDRIEELNEKLDKLNNYLDQLVNGDSHGKDDTLIDKRYQNKIVYKNSASENACRSDCNARGGTFNSCGNVCAPGVASCVAVCGKICTDFEDDNGSYDPDLVNQARNKIAELRSDASEISVKISAVQAAVNRATSELNATSNGYVRQKMQRAIDYGNSLISDMQNLKTRAESIATQLENDISTSIGNENRLRAIIRDAERTISSLASKVDLLVGKLEKLTAFIDNVLAQWQQDEQSYNNLVTQVNSTSSQLWQEIDELRFQTGDIETALSRAHSHDRNDNTEYSRRIDRAIKYGEGLKEERDYLERRAIELLNARNVGSTTGVSISELTRINRELASLLERLDERITGLNTKLDKLNAFLDLVINHSPPPVPTSPPPSLSPSPSITPSPTPVAVSVNSSTFQPANITVRSGTRVTWKNNDSQTHRIVSDNGKFSSGTLSNGSSFSIVFKTPGTYSYHCSLHPEVKGTITVTN